MHTHILSPQPDCAFLSVWKHLGSLTKLSTKLWIINDSSLVHLPMIYQIMFCLRCWMRVRETKPKKQKTKQTTTKISCFTSRDKQLQSYWYIDGVSRGVRGKPCSIKNIWISVLREWNTQNVPQDQQEQPDK